MEDLDIKIEKIEDESLKGLIVENILKDLPEWFGLEASKNQYVVQAKALDLWAARSSGDYIGFISLKETSESTGEIHCMGVVKDYHRMGIGRKLYRSLEEYSKGNYKYLQVKTVDEGNYPEYDRTIDFYREVGFSKLEVFPTLWDEWNPCLIMVKKI